MRYVALAVALIVVIGATTALAADQPQDLRKQKYDLEKQLRTAKSEAAKDPEIQALQTKATDARKAYDKALVDFPAVKEADQKIADLEKQLKDLRKHKQDALKTAEASEPIKALKQGQTDAEAALTKAVSEKPAVKELLEKLDQLMKQMPPAEERPARVKHAVEKPPVEKPPAEKPAEK